MFLEFSVDTDKDQALGDIRAKLVGVINDLPAEADEPSVNEISFTDVPVLSVAIYGDVPGRALINRTNALKDVLEVPGHLNSAADVFNLPLKAVGDTVVTFGDVASVTRTFKDATEYAYDNGSPEITIDVKKRLGTIIIEVSDQIHTVTETVVKDWPEGVEHSFLLDQSVSTKNLYRARFKPPF